MKKQSLTSIAVCMLKLKTPTSISRLMPSLESKTLVSPFLFLAIDLPPPPLFQDSVEKNIIPQVTIQSLLAKFDGKTTQVFWVVLYFRIAWIAFRNLRVSWSDTSVNVFRRTSSFTSSASQKTCLLKKKIRRSSISLCAAWIFGNVRCLFQKDVSGVSLIDLRCRCTPRQWYINSVWSHSQCHAGVRCWNDAGQGKHRLESSFGGRKRWWEWEMVYNSRPDCWGDT